MNWRTFLSLAWGLVSVAWLHAQADSIALRQEPTSAEQGGTAQNAVEPVALALRYAETITQHELREHLTIIASDAYMGRDTGKEGQKMAAAYLRKQFIQAGIPPVPAAGIVDGYFQPFDVVETRSGTITLEKDARKYTYGKEIIYFQENLTEGEKVNGLVFIPARAVPDIRLKGRAVWIDAADQTGLVALGSLRSQMDVLRLSGAALIFVTIEGLDDVTSKVHTEDTRMRLADQETKEGRSERQPQVIIVEKAAMNSLIGRTLPAKWNRKKELREVPANFDIRVTEGEQRLTTENVLAYIEGSDKKDELVVLTAHYDHVGVKDGVVYNGADDDGTGTVAMIEIAEAFAEAKAAGHGPRRSVLVMTVSGEEKGLLGSRYYSDNPVFPLENTVVDLNIDMIGRRDSAHATTPPYIYVIGSDRLSTGLHDANELANKTYTKLDLDYRFNAENDPNRFYYRSDHYNFARKGVPSVFYFSGIHEDYHQPGDDVEKIDFELLHQRSLLAFHTAWILANQEERIVVDRPIKP